MEDFGEGDVVIVHPSLSRLGWVVGGPHAAVVECFLKLPGVVHLAEHRATWPGKRGKTGGAPLLVDGRQHWVTYDDIELNEDDFPTIADAFVAAGGAERRAALGLGEVRSCRMRELVDFAVSWIEQHRSPRATEVTGAGR